MLTHRLMNNQMEELAVDLKITRFFSSIQLTFTKPIKQPFPLQFGAAINLSSGTILHSHNNQEMLQLCQDCKIVRRKGMSGHHRNVWLTEK